MSDNQTTPLKRGELKLYGDNVENNNEGERTPAVTSAVTCSGVFNGVLLCLLSLFTGIMFSVVAPLYPQLGVQKGLTVTQTGLVIGIFGIFNAVFSLVFGEYVSRIGVRFLFVSSVLSASVLFSLFGVLAYFPAGSLFLVFSLLIRVLEGICAAAIEVSLLIRMTAILPAYASTLLGVMESVSTVGEIIGPVFGTAIYQVSNFVTPFITCGVAMALIGIILTITLHTQTDVIENTPSVSILRLLRSIRLYVFVLANTAAFIVFGALTSIIGLYLKTQFDDPELVIGLTYVSPALAYVLTTPLWGLVADKKPLWGRISMVIGYVISGMVLTLIGPAPFISPIRNKHWAFWVYPAINGAFISTSVLNYKELATIGSQYEDEKTDSNPAVCGILSFSMYIGLFLGSIFGGVFMDNFGFRMTSSLIGMFMWLAALLVAMLAVYDKCRHNEDKNDIEKFPETELTEFAESRHR